MNEIKPEIAVAAKWWADQLRDTPKHDNGDAFQSAFATVTASMLKRPTSEQVERFETELATALSSALGFSGDSWREDDPMWASGARVIGVDYHPDQILEDALNAAGIGDGFCLLPFKTLMWIDPNSVNVAQGYGARSEPIYPALAQAEKE